MPVAAYDPASKQTTSQQPARSNSPKLTKEQMNKLLDDLEQARPPVSQGEVKRVGLPFLRQFGPYRSTVPPKK